MKYPENHQQKAPSHGENHLDIQQSQEHDLLVCDESEIPSCNFDYGCGTDEERRRGIVYVYSSLSNRVEALSTSPIPNDQELRERFLRSTQENDSCMSQTIPLVKLPKSPSFLNAKRHMQAGIRSGKIAFREVVGSSFSWLTSKCAHRANES